MKRIVLLLGVAVLAFAAVAVASPAKEIMAGAKLDAMQDHAKSNGKGTFTATINGTKLTWKLSFHGLTGAAAAAHIHLGAKGKSGNVLIALCGPCKSTMSGTARITAKQLRDVEKGLTYVNVHTAKYPNGEIRGQIAAH
ncbi:MAG TPA: CHRD domain-containing protein [Gaiellaceae bacterium]